MEGRLQASTPASNCPAGATFSQPGLRKSVGRYGGLNGDFVLVEGQGEVEADGVDELVEVGGDSLIEAVEMRSFSGRGGRLGLDGGEETGGGGGRKSSA